MTFLTSDLHGREDEFFALLERSGFFSDGKNKLYILGDVIDRNGDGGVRLLEWIMSNPSVELILGNHERMMLDSRWAFDANVRESLGKTGIDTGMVTELERWRKNGAAPTIEALKARSPEGRVAIFDFLAACPLYREIEVNGARYVLVHGGLGGFDSSRELSEYSADELVWTRPYLSTRYSPESYTVIIGHTPTHLYDKDSRGRMLRSDGGWWNVDTGAAGDGSPMLLCLDTLSEYYI